MSTTSIRMEASTSADSLVELQALSSDVADTSTSLMHPVTNKSIPPTAIVMRHVTKVSTPGSFPQDKEQDTGGDVSSSDSEDESVSAAPKTYMTQQRKREAKAQKIQARKQLYETACQQYQQGQFKSIFEASKHFRLPYSSLHKYLVFGDSFIGKGRKSQVLTIEEEQKIVAHVIYRQKIGCGMTFLQLQLLVQEVLVAVTAANPARSSPYGDKGHFPDRFFARRLATRNNLTLRATMEISKGRQILSVDDLVAWQRDTEAGLVNNEVLAECFKNGDRVFNQDETSVQVGSGSEKVLAVKGTKVLYNFSGSSREHVTASFTVSASGGCVPVRTIFKGVRNMAAQHLKNLPTNGKSGGWKFGVTANGYVTREAFMDILQDLDEYLVEKNVTRPVILFMDGQKGHISLEAAAFCKLKQIQPWLLRANMTHLLQALDLTFFSSLKKKLNQLAHHWHADPKNVGQSLSKYSVMWVLHEATEICLANSSLIPNDLRRGGLFPWDPSAPDKTKLLPGTVYASTSAPPVAMPSYEEGITQIPEDISMSAPSLPSLFQEVEYVAPLIAESVITDDAAQLSPGFSGNFQNEFSSNTTDFDPPLSSTFHEIHSEFEQPDQPYWYGRTQMCTSCNRRILNSVFESHFNICGAGPSSVDGNIDEQSGLAPPTSRDVQQQPGEELDTTENITETLAPEEIKLSTLPSFTLDDRSEHLEKFEVVLLKKSQVKEFEEMFLKKEFTSINDPLYRAWLHLKFAAAGTETEAIDRLLSSKVAKNVQKRKTKRKDPQPSGPARYDPSSPEWVAILTEQRENKKTTAAPKRKPTAAVAKKTAKKKKTSTKENNSDMIV